MNSVFGALHHLRMHLQPDKNQKNRQQKVFRFTAGSIFWPISRVMGVINEFGFRWFGSFTDALTARKKNQSNRRQKVSVFIAGSIFWPISLVMGVINEFGFRWFASFTVCLQPDKNQ